MLAFRPESPPVLLLGGLENSLSIVRSLGRKDIPVRVAAVRKCPALSSRFCKDRYIIPATHDPALFWQDLLLGSGRATLSGSLILACDDDAVGFMANNRAELEQHYILDDSIPALQLTLLDKQMTLELARSAGCAAPQFWKVETIDDLEPIHSALTFPIMVKPIYSHLFHRALGEKFLIAHSHEELVNELRRVFAHEFRVMLCEIIPGSDNVVQSSYYTYIDGQGESVFRFTKRVLRRTPTFGGRSVLHMTQWLPETAEAGERFLRGIGFRGMANVEFKRDLRDGQLKIIECNPRFTTAQELLVRCGIDAAFLIYCRLTGRPISMPESYRQNIFLWYPVRDTIDQVKGQHGLSASEWLNSIFHWNTVFPCFTTKDPWPLVSLAVHELQERWRDNHVEGREVAVKQC